jgi:AraC-like DNA-binding protein
MCLSSLNVTSYKKEIGMTPSAYRIKENSEMP